MRKTLFVLLFLILPATLFAQSPQGSYRRYYAPAAKFELTPFVGYRWGGTLYADSTYLFHDDVDVESSANYGLNFGIPVGNTPMKIELMVNHQNSRLVPANGGLFTPGHTLADMQITYYHVGLQVPFAQNPGAIPYAIVSAGVSHLNPDVAGATSADRFSMSAGLGVKIPINHNVGIRLEGRGYFTSMNNYDNGYGGCYNCSYNGYNHDLYQGEVNGGFIFRF